MFESKKGAGENEGVEEAVVARRFCHSSFDDEVQDLRGKREEIRMFEMMLLDLIRELEGAKEEQGELEIKNKGRKGRGGRRMLSSPGFLSSLRAQTWREKAKRFSWNRGRGRVKV